MSTANVDPASDAESASIRIVTEIAEMEGIDPTEVQPPLNDVIDPEAVDALLDRAGRPAADVRLQFTYCDYEVEVAADGAIDVVPVAGLLDSASGTATES